MRRQAEEDTVTDVRWRRREVAFYMQWADMFLESVEGAGEEKKMGQGPRRQRSQQDDIPGWFGYISSVAAWFLRCGI